jgi:glycosyltransferase involved in cell wall biosynthesis
LGNNLKVSVLIPCYNEEKSIARVIGDFRVALPFADIYVYDNNSTDKTSDVARSCGAIVRNEFIQGKGSVVRRMFADIESDIYLIVDGDGTYDARVAPDMINKLITENFDMVAAARISEDAKTAYRWGHVFGNRLLSGIVRVIFGQGFDDILTGYRVFSRRFVKTFPAVSCGFEIETELAIHALSLHLPCAEVFAQYGARDYGSKSKLSTWKDGIKILLMILKLAKSIRPLWVFGVVFFIFFVLSIVLGLPIVSQWMETGLVPRMPTALLSASLMILAFLNLFCGVMLDTVSHQNTEIKKMFYLSFPSLGHVASLGSEFRGVLDTEDQGDKKRLHSNSRGFSMDTKTFILDVNKNSGDVYDER